MEDDFKLTISTAKNVYNMDDLFTTNPLDITATVRYLGNEDEITIYHGEPIVAISLRHKNGKLQLGTDILDIGCSSVIKSKKEYLFSQDYVNDYYKEGLIKGDYVAVAYIKIVLDEEFKNKINFSSEVPFSI
ncbi:hypothetical protein SH2C18_44850 [Clostridium sediminicola]|uniref:hypothetical protein n=1 Tax=Clostridium sediminicola TaxID=3114879 RepID=UPI0031F1D89F